MARVAVVSATPVFSVIAPQHPAPPSRRLPRGTERSAGTGSAPWAHRAALALPFPPR